VLRLRREEGWLEIVQRVLDKKKLRGILIFFLLLPQIQSVFVGVSASAAPLFINHWIAYIVTN
jgi:hypothetical protein